MELEEHVEEALNTFLREEFEGGFVTDFFVIANVMTTDGEQKYLYTTSSGQLLGTSMGLVQYAEGVLRFQQTEALIDWENVLIREEEEDDDDSA